MASLQMRRSFLDGPYRLGGGASRKRMFLEDPAPSTYWPFKDKRLGNEAIESSRAWWEGGSRRRIEVTRT